MITKNDDDSNSAFWLSVVIAVFLTFSGYLASKYNTINPCRAMVRMINSDCTKYLNAQQCSEANSMTEDQFTTMWTNGRGHFECFLHVAANEFVDGLRPLD